MPRKAIDARIPALIRNGIQEKKRSYIVVVGDRAKDVIVHLHYIMSSVDIKQNRSVLWAYKKDLIGFSSHRKKREAKIRKEIKRGLREPNAEDPFELFVSLNSVRYVYYKETDKILGNTYGMAILQDFEAVTPNLLARTVETVEGGGLILLLLKGMNSLKQLYTLTMDAHTRYRTEAYTDVVARFNERFILSLGSCASCLVVDDELNVLPISGGKNITALALPDGSAESTDPALQRLKELKEQHQDEQPVGSLVKLARTVDQAEALLTFVDAIAEKTLRSTVTLTAARGRGKSAALGMAIAAAVAFGYSNIFITSPSPENLKTLFDFVFKGFDALDYLDHADYTIIQSTNPEFNKAIVRVNVHRNHRQTIQYIQPQDAFALGQAELLIIDEAAAIPLPLVRKLMGPYLVFMASTIHGYEGTGRSLSLKLIQQLREQSRALPASSDTKSTDDSKTNGSATASVVGRKLREITLTEPIRYAAGDEVEKWLNRLLCLEATLPRARMQSQGCVHPSECQLLQVNRDTLFSFHPVSEKFLQQMMALYVASHYKNSPNDLQLMSDAPAHQLYVLVPPIDDASTRLPEPLCVLQVALEGQISRQSVLDSLGRGQRAGGDLIPWLVSQQFQDEDFAGLSGARVVRIATHPDYLSMGYGRRALELLIDFYEHRFLSLSEDAALGEPETLTRATEAELEQSNLLADDVHVRDIQAMPPLFAKLSERRPPALDYVGVSYGLTPSLHRFWKRAGFVPVYLRQTTNELTGEHSCVMLRALQTGGSDPGWLGAYARDFQKRLHSLLSGPFRAFPAVLALSLDEAAAKGASQDPSTAAKPLSTRAEIDAMFSPFDLKRLDSYASNMLDYHVILDLLPTVAGLYFAGRLSESGLASNVETTANGDSEQHRNNKAPSSVKLSGVQAALLLALGLQRRELDEVGKELKLPASQLLAMFVKVVRKISGHFRSILEGEVIAAIPQAADAAAAAPEPNGSLTGHAGNNANQPSSGKTALAELNAELRESASEVNEALRAQQRALVDALPLERYGIESRNHADMNADWTAAEAQVDRVLNRQTGQGQGQGQQVETNARGTDLASAVPTVSVRRDKSFGPKGNEWERGGEKGFAGANAGAGADAGREREGTAHRDADSTAAAVTADQSKSKSKGKRQSKKRTGEHNHHTSTAQGKERHSVEKRRKH